MTFSSNIFAEKGRGFSSALYLFTALFLVGTTAPLKAAVELTAIQMQVYESASEVQRVHFLIERAKMGRSELVEALLQKYPLQGPHARNRTLFVEGLLLGGNGDLTGAVEKYRAALANDPSLTLVRAQLAQTLVTLGKDESAKHHLTQLQAEAPSEEASGRIRSFIEKIDSRKPLTFNGFISLAPTTNLNNGTTASKVYTANPDYSDVGYFIPSAATQQQSGVGLSAGINVGYSKRLGNDLELVLAADVAGQVYLDRIYDSVSLSQSAEMRYHIDKGYVGFGAVANEAVDPNAKDFLHDGLTYKSYGPRVSFLYFASQHDVINGSAVYEWQDNTNSDVYDGTAFLTDFSYNHGFDSTFNVTMSGGYNKIDSQLAFNSYATYFGGLGFYKELPLGITVNANTQVRLSTFDAVNPVFFMTRHDERYIGSIALTKRDLNFKGFAPALAYTYTYNNSNIAAYEFDSHAVDFRLTKNF